ncbi:hypothetical protein NEOKW01_1021 [Nematocida sp. AWRm80]|nr:hypothetical protein NEOKW01_1021 [Nematocida sp. AWRm80]
MHDIFSSNNSKLVIIGCTTVLLGIVVFVFCLVSGWYDQKVETVYTKPITQPLQAQIEPLMKEIQSMRISPIKELPPTTKNIENQYIRSIPMLERDGSRIRLHTDNTDQLDTCLSVEFFTADNFYTRLDKANDAFDINGTCTLTLIDHHRGLSGYLKNMISWLKHKGVRYNKLIFCATDISTSIAPLLNTDDLVDIQFRQACISPNTFQDISMSPKPFALKFTNGCTIDNANTEVISMPNIPVLELDGHFFFPMFLIDFFNIVRLDNLNTLILNRCAIKSLDFLDSINSTTLESLTIKNNEATTRIRLSILNTFINLKQLDIYNNAGKYLINTSGYDCKQLKGLSSMILDYEVYRHLNITQIEFSPENTHNTMIVFPKISNLLQDKLLTCIYDHLKREISLEISTQSMLAALLSQIEYPYSMISAESLVVTVQEKVDNYSFAVQQILTGLLNTYKESTITILTINFVNAPYIIESLNELSSLIRYTSIKKIVINNIEITKEDILNGSEELQPALGGIISGTLLLYSLQDIKNTMIYHVIPRGRTSVIAINKYFRTLDKEYQNSGIKISFLNSKLAFTFVPYREKSSR